jgi:hypothetical protein
MWLAGRPSAGGKAPEWQVEHCPATGTWLWFHLVGRQALVLWQLTQLTEVGMCAGVFPVAELPLWQLVQLVAAVNRVWSGFELLHVAVDLWQLSHTVCPAWIAVDGRAVSP